MPIREESYDLFGSSADGVYTPYKAVTSSAVTSSLLDLRSTAPAVASEYRVTVEVGTAFAGGTDLTVALYCGTKSGNSYTWDDTAFYTSPTVATNKLTAGKKLVDIRLPRDCKRHIKAVATPTGTHTAGTIFGNVEAVV